MRTWLAALFLAIAATSSVMAAHSPSIAAGTNDSEEHDGEPDAAERAWQAAQVQASRARFAELSQLPLPRDRAVAVLQVDLWDPSARATTLAQAAEAAPDDIVVQWIATHLRSGGTDSCAQDGAEPKSAERLVMLDFDNAAAHLPRLSRAWRDGNTAAVDSSIAAMAAASRYDSYFFDVLEAGLKLWQQFPPPHEAETADADPYAASVVASLSNAALVMPDYSALVGVCDAGTVDLAVNVRRFAACGDIGRRMIAASTWIDRSIGFVVLRRSGQLTAVEAIQKTQFDALKREAGRLMQAEATATQAVAVQMRALVELRDESAAAERLVSQFAGTAQAAAQ